jgi:hypothetical protein
MNLNFGSSAQASNVSLGPHHVVAKHFTPNWTLFQLSHFSKCTATQEGSKLCFYPHSIVNLIL